MICPEKKRLIDELAIVIKSILELHSLETEALIRGAESPDPAVAARLVTQQARRASLLAELKAHVAEHRC